MRGAWVGLLLLCSVSWGQTLTREQAVAVAMQHSPLLKVAQSESKMAHEAVRTAKSELQPKLSLNGLATTGNGAGVFGIAGAEPASWMMVPTGSFLDGSLMLMVPILTPKQQNMVDAARASSNAVLAEVEEVRSEVALQVSLAFNQVLLQREMVVAEEFKVSASSELVRTTQATVDAGKGIEASVQRAQAELSRAKRTLATAKNDESKAILQLQIAMGTPFKEPITVAGDLPLGDMNVEVEKEVQLALAQRNSILAANSRVIGSRADLRRAESQRSPQLYGFAMAERPNRRDMGGLTFGITLSIPILDGGRIGSEVQQARAAIAKAEAILQLAKLTVEREVREACLDLSTAAANTISALDSVRATEASYKVIALRVSAGKGIMLEQLDALEIHKRALADLAQARYEQAIALAKLNRAKGGTK